MAKPKFAVGERVRLYDPEFPDCWANGATGTIGQPPAPVAELGGGWNGHIRFVATTTGTRPFYWIQLDEPRRDAEGDGPYNQAEIAESSLHSIPSAARAV